MEALIYHCAEKRILISGDALWENGFGVVFPELDGEQADESLPKWFLEAAAGLAIFVAAVVDTLTIGETPPELVEC